MMIRGLVVVQQVRENAIEPVTFGAFDDFVLLSGGVSGVLSRSTRFQSGMVGSVLRA